MLFEGYGEIDTPITLSRKALNLSRQILSAHLYRRVVHLLSGLGSKLRMYPWRFRVGDRVA